MYLKFKISTIFSNATFFAGFFISLFLFFYSTYKIIYPPEFVSTLFYKFCLAFSAMFSIFFLIGIYKIKDNIRLNLAIIFFSIGITLLTFETYIEYYGKYLETFRNLEFKRTSPAIIANKMGIPYDKRTKLEFLDDLRNLGLNAYPLFTPSDFSKTDGLRSKNKQIFSLAGISNSITYFGNELGFYPIIETDEYGFNNPKGLYKENTIDILLTGDSFAEGHSVKRDKNIAAFLRKSDYKTLSIGKGGNGSLIQFASIKEYGLYLKPKILIWFYYINDLEGLSKEIESPLLMRYLEDENYSQNLMSRQEEIDDVLKNYFKKFEDEHKILSKKTKKSNNVHLIRIINILELTNLRKLLKIVSPSRPKDNDLPLNIFNEIIEKSNEAVSKWGGEMYFVYLPNMFIKDNYKEKILEIVKQLNIEIIDIEKEVFENHPDPESLYPFRMYGHYNAEGYALVAEKIMKKITKDGYIKINN